MRKEVLIAIILGFGLGLVITFGIWTANKTLKQKELAPAQDSQDQEETSATQTANPTPANLLSLAIISPENESLQDKEKIALSGITAPQAIVAVISENDDLIIEADETGRFDSEITLDAGTNEITVTATNESGEETTKIIDVVYSTATN